MQKHAEVNFPLDRRGKAWYNHFRSQQVAQVNR